MNKDEATEKLQRQLSYISELERSSFESEEFKKWKRDTEVVVRRVFGEGSSQLKDFSKITYKNTHFSRISSPSYTTDDKAIYARQFAQGLNEAKAVVASFVQEVDEFGIEMSEQTVSQLTRLENLCSRFHLVAKQIRLRHNNRPTLEIKDEYDVQDLFHALLFTAFDDIRKEEWTPSYAGSASRIDFILKQDRIAIETKKTRKGLGTKELGEQLLIDIQKYKVHPYCQTLFCLVYDPEDLIVNPRGIENDLSGPKSGLDVQVFITPKGL